MVAASEVTAELTALVRPNSDIQVHQYTRQVAAANSSPGFHYRLPDCSGGRIDRCRKLRVYSLHRDHADSRQRRLVCRPTKSATSSGVAIEAT